MRPASRAEIAGWDALVAANPDGGHILQTRAWGEFKRRHGWVPNYLVDERDGADVAMLAMVRRIPGLGALHYMPKGPGIADIGQLAGVCDQLRTSSDAFCWKLEPELIDDEATRGRLLDIGLVKAAHDVQINRATIIVDISGDEDALLASFKPKTRYNIRLATRRGVTVEAVPLDDVAVDTMYRLMAATRDRAGFTLRSREYFAGYWRLHEAAGQGQLFFARWQGQVLAGVFATFLGRKGWYKDGGSLKEHADVMAPHLLQWEVMRWLRTRGVRSYDLVAVPGRDQLREDHPLWGLYRFKSGFSERISEFVGTWDLPVSRIRYGAWSQVAERAYHQWAYRVRHDLFY